MIISHTHRYVFIKTRKTAGTSMEIALSQHCGSSDIITPIRDEDEEIRRELGFRGPQNFRARDQPDMRLRLPDDIGDDDALFSNHVGAARVRRLMGKPAWNSYYRFCFERNPWEKVISAYWFRFPDGDRAGLERFILDGTAADISDYHRYARNGELLVNRVCRFEDLAQELAAVCGQLGLPPLVLPRAKGAIRKDKRPYREVLGDEERRVIADAFAAEIELLGYCW